MTRIRHVIYYACLTFRDRWLQETSLRVIAYFCIRLFFYISRNISRYSRQVVYQLRENYNQLKILPAILRASRYKDTKEKKKKEEKRNLNKKRGRPLIPVVINKRKAAILVIVG